MYYRGRGSAPLKPKTNAGYSVRIDWPGNSERKMAPIQEYLSNVKYPGLFGAINEYLNGKEFRDGRKFNIGRIFGIYLAEAANVLGEHINNNDLSNAKIVFNVKDPSFSIKNKEHLAFHNPETCEYFFDTTYVTMRYDFSYLNGTKFNLLLRDKGYDAYKDWLSSKLGYQI